jgi:hypothetical protein
VGDTEVIQNGVQGSVDGAHGFGGTSGGTWFVNLRLKAAQMDDSKSPILLNRRDLAPSDISWRNRKNGLEGPLIIPVLVF